MQLAACGEFGSPTGQGLKAWGRQGGSWSSMIRCDPMGSLGRHSEVFYFRKLNNWNYYFI
jgi:hypothetical protein